MTARHWIAGEWGDCAAGATAASINPSTGEVLGSFADGNGADALAGINAARECLAGSAWAHQPRLRAQILLDFADKLAAASNEIATALARENGKLLEEARHEVTSAVSELRYYAGLARNIFGRVTEVDPGQFSMLAREPMGVAGIIVPWNAPITLLIRSLAPAIAAGCTSVTKAAPQTALVNAMVFELLAQVDGIPPGAVNMLNETGNDVAKLLVNSPDVDVISFTGSTQVGKVIMAAASATLKRVTLELGGSAPCVVFADANLDLAVSEITRAAMAHAGQVCVAASRIIADQAIAADLQAKLTDSLAGLRLGTADNPDSQLGPLIDERSCERMTALIAASKNAGELVLEGQRVRGELANGAFFSPSLLRVGDSNAEFLQQEIFGPLLTVDTFADEFEAADKANNTRFGLAASVWTSDQQRGLRLANQIKSGTVWLNAHMQFHAEIETGGYRESGLGRLQGIEGLDQFLQTKHISWRT